jgi:hypothetical protein
VQALLLYQSLQREVAALEQARDEQQSTVSWHVTTGQARTKLERFGR